MKKFIRALLITAACMAGLGLLFSVAGLLWTGKVVGRLTPEQAVEQTFPLEMEGKRRLTLQSGAAEVRIEESDEAKVVFEGFTEDEMTVEWDEHAISIRSRDVLGGKSIINFGVFRIDWLGRLHTGTLEQRVITLYLPQQDMESVTLELGAGNLKGTLPLHADTLTVKCGAGNVELSDLSAGSIDFSRGAGNILLDNVTCDSLELSAGMGNVDILDAEVAESARIECGTGNMTLCGGVWHDMDVVGGMGNFTFDGRLLGESSIEGGVGNVDLTLMDKAEEYNGSITRGMGEVRVTGAQTLTDEEGSILLPHSSYAPNALTIEMGTGKVTLRFAE